MYAWRLIVLLATGLPIAAVAGDEHAAEVAIEPVDCVSIGRIRRTEILSDTTILFHMNGGVIYRNELPRRCAGLRMAGTYSYRTSLSQLCDVDVITVQRNLGSPGGFSGPSCGLGKFQPITPEQADLLRAEPVTPDPDAVTPEVESTEDSAD